MMIAPFDVVVVSFPYSDRLAEKRRPALVVSASPLNEGLDRLWVAMITSAGGRLIHGDLEVANLTSAGLPAASILRASKLATIDRDRVLRTAGRLDAKDRTAAIEALRSCAAF